MDNKEWEQVYLALCEKAKSNLLKMGNDLYEYPAVANGQYFEQDKTNLRKVGHIFSWTQSFFTGMAALAFEQTEDENILNRLNSFYGEYFNKVFGTPLESMHDLGFLYTLYSTILFNLTGDKKMLELSIKAADVLAHRFVPQGGYIRAWGRMDDKIPEYIDEKLAQDQFFQKSKGLAIIDCMMNLPLLFFAFQQTGNPLYLEVATAHADTTLKYFVRKDYSVCHAYRFALDGSPKEEFNGCGYGIGSHWARGTAWAIYGFAVAYRYTKNEKYYNVAENLATVFVSRCKDDGMPVWDFELPQSAPIDTSACAITCCGVLELLKTRENAILSQYVSKACNTLVKKYINFNPDVSGILSNQNGADSFACYGDYFIMELLRNMRESSFNIW